MGFQKGDPLMVKILEIRSDRSYCRLVLDNGEIIRLRQKDLSAAGFQEGVPYQSDSFHRQILLMQYPRALNHAVSMLARRPCSRKEITDRLLRLLYTEEVTELVIYKLEKEKLLNDEEFCEQWVRYRLMRKIGPAVIRQELKIKGIPEDTVNSVISRMYKESGWSNAVALACKAWGRVSSCDDVRKSRQKVIASLIRKGYDWTTAKSACEEAENMGKARI